MTVQVKDRIGSNIVGVVKRQIRGQSDVFGTFGKGLFKVPYCTDISRGT